MRRYVHFLIKCRPPWCFIETPLITPTNIFIFRERKQERDREMRQFHRKNPHITLFVVTFIIVAFVALITTTNTTYGFKGFSLFSFNPSSPWPWSSTTTTTIVSPPSSLAAVTPLGLNHSSPPNPNTALYPSFNVIPQYILLFIIAILHVHTFIFGGCIAKAQMAPAQSIASLLHKVQSFNAVLACFNGIKIYCFDNNNIFMYKNCNVFVISCARTVRKSVIVKAISTLVCQIK